MDDHQFYRGVWPQMKLNFAVTRVLMRDWLDHKREPEDPYIPHMVQPDDICLHIGATDGRHSHTMAMAMKDGTGRILAFEPSPVTFPILQRANQLRGLSKRISVKRLAFSDAPRRLRLNVPIKSPGRIGNSFGFTSDGAPKMGRNGVDDKRELLAFDVDATTIDAVANDLPRVDFIRMDIEGSERLALKGGWDTIVKHKPHILIEIHPDLLRNHFDTDPQTIYDEFTALGYEIYHLEGDKIVRSPDLNIRPWKDYFFIHKDRKHTLPI